MCECDNQYININVRTSIWMCHYGCVRRNMSLWMCRYECVIMNVPLWMCLYECVIMKVSLWKCHCESVIVNASLWMSIWMCQYECANMNMSIWMCKQPFSVALSRSDINLNQQKWCYYFAKIIYIYTFCIRLSLVNIHNQCGFFLNTSIRFIVHCIISVVKPKHMLPQH